MQTLVMFFIENILKWITNVTKIIFWNWKRKFYL